MPDEIEAQDENADATADESKEKATGTDQTKTVKTFSQEDVNKVVAREKASWKRTHDKVLADKDVEITSVQATQKDAEKIVAEQVKTLKADLNIDEDEWELTMADRDVFTQYVYLAKKVEKAGKKHVTETPKGEKFGNVAFERINKI